LIVLTMIRVLAFTLTLKFSAGRFAVISETVFGFCELAQRLAYQFLVTLGRIPAEAHLRWKPPPRYADDSAPFLLRHPRFPLITILIIRSLRQTLRPCRTSPTDTESSDYPFAGTGFAKLLPVPSGLYYHVC
jgi:hypothetical protein